MREPVDPTRKYNTYLLQVPRTHTHEDISNSTLYALQQLPKGCIGNREHLQDIALTATCKYSHQDAVRAAPRANMQRPSTKTDTRPQDDALVPTTYCPPATQRFHEQMGARVARKPYGHYFHTFPLYIRREALAAVPRPIRYPEADVLPLARARALLAPGAHAVENGWYAYPDGTAYVASRTQFPGCTGTMVDWWFWWHSVEAERYALWYPYSHCAVESTYARRTTSAYTPVAKLEDAGGGSGGRGTSRARRREVPILERDDVSHRHKWLGSTHTVSEFIGAKRMTLRIEFKEPSYFGLGSWEDLRKAGYEAAVCGLLWDERLPMKVGDMIHLWRRNETGLELRSRYYLAHQVYLDVFGLLKIPVDRIGGMLGIKQWQAGDKVAYEQFLHDQTEFTNLARILPGLYEEFGGEEKQGTPG